jgi:hypothetical protein
MEYQKKNVLHLVDNLPTTQKTKKDVSKRVRNCTNEELVHIFNNRKLIENLLDATNKELFSRARQESIEGVKITLSHTRRKWIADEAEVAKTVKELGGTPYQSKLVGITEVEKEIGKNKLDDVTTQTEAKLILVEDSDKREAVSPRQDLLNCVNKLGD